MKKDFDELNVIAKIQDGNFQAFRDLFDCYYQPLCNYANSLIHDIFKAEDVVLEVFEKLWDMRRKLAIQVSVKSYLYTAVRNKCLNTQKSDTVRLEYFARYTRNKETFIEPSEIEAEEFRQFLHECISKLPPRCKDIFEQSRFENLKQEKIAEKMEISVKTVKAQIGKALKYVKECLSTIYPEYL